MVLDASAVCRFPSMRIGEVIAELNDDGVQFGVSVAALASAGLRVGMVPVEILVKNAAFSALELGLDRWRQVCAALELIPSSTQRSATTHPSSPSEPMCPVIATRGRARFLLSCG
jgi:hypothetical protein